MVMGVDIDPRVYMGKSSRSRKFRIKSYEKYYRCVSGDLKLL